MKEKTRTKHRNKPGYTTRRISAMILTLSMLLTMQGFTTFAQTISENEAITETKEIPSSSAASAAPANPVHNCTKSNDGSDTTTWSYIYFGSYPQSEVTDAATIAAIDRAITAGNGTTADAGTDVWVNSIKYRRISKSDTNYSGYFDDVTNNGYRYFRWKRIKWRVLQNDGNSLFVLADTALDCKDYNDEYVSTTWETSTLRNWLNDSFYQTAFSSAEQNAIITQTVVNEDNPYYDTEGGNNTTDNVYLLSLGEVMDESYGFCSDYSTYSVSRRLQTSAYANARGALRPNRCWWLRSPGKFISDAASVGGDGYVYRDGIHGCFDRDVVAPALHINLSSDLWSLTDDGSSGDEAKDVKVTRLSITAPSKKLAAGKKVKLTLNVTPSNATNKAVTWKSSNTQYATVDKNGKITLKKAGAGKTVKITATAKDGSGKKASIKIAIMKHAVKSIKLKAPSTTVKATESLQLKAVITTTGSKANKSLKWTSSNTKYATVSKSGKVKTKKAGKGKTVKITAMATDGSGKKATIKIKIK